MVSTKIPEIAAQLFDSKFQSHIDCDPVPILRQGSVQMHARMGLLEAYLPSSKGRPWVAPNNTSFLDGSPAAGIDDSVMGRAWGSWEVASLHPPPSPECWPLALARSQPSIQQHPTSRPCLAAEADLDANCQMGP